MKQTKVGEVINLTMPYRVNVKKEVLKQGELETLLLGSPPYYLHFHLTSLKRDSVAFTRSRTGGEVA